MYTAATNPADPEERAVLEEAERYCRAHPRSPTAVRHPRILRRGRKFIALLGSTLEDGIAGIGESVVAALQAFDAQYVERLRPRR